MPGKGGSTIRRTKESRGTRVPEEAALPRPDHQRRFDTDQHVVGNWRNAADRLCRVSASLGGRGAW